MLVSHLCSHTLARHCDTRPRELPSCPSPSSDAIFSCSFREVPKIKSDNSWSLRITYYKNSITKWQTHIPIRKLKKESQTKVNFKTENAGLCADRKCLYSQKIFWSFLSNNLSWCIHVPHAFWKLIDNLFRKVLFTRNAFILFCLD